MTHRSYTSQHMKEKHQWCYSAARVIWILKGKKIFGRTDRQAVKYFCKIDLYDNCATHIWNAITKSLRKLLPIMSFFRILGVISQCSLNQIC